MMQQQDKLLPKAVAAAEELEEATDRRRNFSSDDVDACPRSSFPSRYPRD